MCLSPGLLQLKQLLPACRAALGSPVNVVHSHASTCIERLLTSKVSAPASVVSPANVVHSYAATCIERLLTSKVC